MVLIKMAASLRRKPERLKEEGATIRFIYMLLIKDTMQMYLAEHIEKHSWMGLE